MTPELWKSFNIDIRGHHSIIGPAIVQWFSRAGSYPTSLTAQLSQGGFGSSRMMVSLWEGLTAVDVRGDAEVNLRNILFFMPRLVSARFEVMESTKGMWFPRVALFDLRNLAIKYCPIPSDIQPGPAFSCLLQELVLPVLEELRLEATEDHFDFALPKTLCSLKRASGFNLRLLCMEHSIWPEEEMVEFLRGVPTLTHLQLKSWGMHCDLIKLIKYTQGFTESVLPNLERLDFYQLGKITLIEDDNIVTEFFESRWWPGDRCPYKHGRLSKLRGGAMIREAICDHTAKGVQWEQITERMNRLRDEGMDITY